MSTRFYPGQTDYIPQLNAMDDQFQSVLTAGPLTTSLGALGGNLNDRSSIYKWTGTDSNTDMLEVSLLRQAAGTGWASAGWRIQQKVDATWMAYIQFSGNANNQGISIGTGSTTTGPNSITERFKIDNNGYATFYNTLETKSSLIVGTTSSNPSIEIGRTDGQASSPYIDFHSGSTAVDYDARIVSNGGTGTTGGGNIQLIGSMVYAAGTTANDSSLEITKVASAVNRVRMYGAITGSTPTIESTGSDTNVNLNINTKGTGSIALFTGSARQAQVTNVTGANRYVNLDGGVAGTSGAGVGVGGGSESLDIYASGGYSVYFATNGKRTGTQFEVAHTPLAVNYGSVTGGVTGSGVALSAKGTDTNIDLNLTAKGTGKIYANNQLISSSGGGANTTNSQLVVQNGAAVGFNFLARASAGAYNSQVAAGDHLLYFSNNATDTGSLVIGGWTSVAGGSGIKIVNASDGGTITLRSKDLNFTTTNAPYSALGLKIGTTTSSDANTLDYYQEGTFTPVISGTTTAGTGTYLSQLGRYTRMGNRVHFSIKVEISAHTGTGNMVIDGLPFTSSASIAATPLQFIAQNLTYSGTPIAYVGASSAQVTLATQASGAGFGSIAMDTACILYVSGTYEV